MQQRGAGAPLPARPRKRRCNEESQMQRALVKWWDFHSARTFGLPHQLLFSIPNGGGRSGPIAGNLMKLEGLRKGAPDLCLAVRNERRAHGALFLEMKTATGRVSPEQAEYHSILQRQGFRVEVVRSVESAIEIIKDHLHP